MMTVRTPSPMTTRALLCLAMGALAGPASGHTIGPALLALTGMAADTLPDLEVRVRAPRTLAPGEALGPTALVRVRNRGTAPAPGAYMIDLVLGSDRTAPEGFAAFSPTYREDVLLRSGRVSSTRDLAPGGNAEHRVADATIPADTPPGSYYLCARIDPGAAVTESDETNNVDCAPLRIEAPAVLLEGGIVPRANPPTPADLPIARDVTRPGLPVPLPAPTTGCPDPAVVELTARLVSRSRSAPRTEGRVEIVAIVENVGRFAYESGPGQQALRLYELGFEFVTGDEPLEFYTGISGHPVASVDFPSLRPGGRVVAYHTVYIDLDVIRPGFRAAIEYDLDIRNDGNPQNDDCDTGNNQREINAEIRRLISEE